MNNAYKIILTGAVLALFTFSVSSWAQDEDADKKPAKKKASSPEIQNVATVGIYYLDHDAYRYGKYSGLTDKGSDRQGV